MKKNLILNYYLDKMFEFVNGHDLKLKVSTIIIISFNELLVYIISKLD